MLRLEILGPQSNKEPQQPSKQKEEEDQDNESDKGEYEEERVVTPSIWEAAKQGNVALVRQVIEDQGKKIVNTRDPETETTLLYTTVAHVRQPESMLRLLVENGAEPDAPSVYGIRALHALPIHCPRPLPSMQLLLDHHADINARDGDNWTPLHYAARFCKEPDTIVRQLVARGANVNAVDASGKSPLFALLANGDHASTLGWLIHSAKAD
ncbi:ankyrin, partial [Lichtheimia hyalospora FSU 10163]